MNLPKLQRANVEFDERDVPIATQFDDPYFSFNGGLDETRFVFIQGNQLEKRLSDGFHIGEIGFGTGLNFFAVWQLWKSLGQVGEIHFTSFEAYPMSPQDRLKSLAPFAEIAKLVEEFDAGFDGETFHSNGIHLHVVHGKANTTLPQNNQEFHAWFLDGFSPAKNPDAWSAPLMFEVGKHTKHNGTVATYSAAGHIRHKLSDAGFTVSRVKGYGHKRHMTIAVKDTD